MRAAWMIGVAQIGCRALLGIENPIREESIDGPLVDSAPIDAAVDAAAIACRVGTGALSVDRGRVGGGGGGVNFPPLVCNTDQVPIAVAVRMSDQNTSFGYRSAHGFELACATVEFDVTGQAIVGPAITTQVQGTGISGWSPSTLTPLTMCREGWILSGLVAHIGVDVMRFADVEIHCTQVSPSGSQIATESIAVTGSLDETSGKTTALCSTNEVVAQLPNRTGAGLDSLNVFCAPLACVP